MKWLVYAGEVLQLDNCDMFSLQSVHSLNCHVEAMNTFRAYIYWFYFYRSFTPGSGLVT